jgi:hypothetical protein
MQGPDARHNIKETLKLATGVDGVDVLKFLTDIFDALFGILDEYAGLEDVRR